MTTSEDTMDTIGRYANVINAEIEEANSLLEPKQKKLQMTSLEYEHWSQLRLCQDDVRNNYGDFLDYWSLGYSQVRGHWCAVARQTRVSIIDSDELEDFRDPYRKVGPSIPILQAPPRVRIEASKHIDEFIKEFSAEVDKTLVELRLNRVAPAPMIPTVPAS